MPLFPRRAGGRGRGRFGCAPRLIIGIVIALVALGMYFFNTQTNPITGEQQRVGNLKPQDEVRMGLAAAPELIQQFDGVSRDAEAQRRVDAIGAELLRQIENLSNAPYEWEFTVLDDDETVNAFALPGGQVFITEALYARLETPGQLAGVLGHEIGHVIHRHGAESMAKANLGQGLTGAVLVATYDPQNPGSAQAAAMAQLVSQFVQMRYGREAEHESDAVGVQLVAKAGYDPRAMIEVMRVLNEASGGGGRAPEWASTHPHSSSRIEHIERLIREAFPDGVPQGLIK